MPAQITGLLGRLQATVKQFSLAQRTLAIIGVAVLVLGAVGLQSWLAKPSMTPLFSGVSAADASAIVDHLESAGVKYELTDGGSTIMVPQGKLYAMRLAVAADGLPTAGEGGYQLLDKMGMTSSEFQQQVTYQRALEGELAKTISSLTGVEAATVRLALPKESVFVKTKADPTASVFVKTTPGAVLGTDKVQSIVHLVSAGIEGMKPADVAVIDADGHVLSSVGATPGSTLQAGQTGDYEARVAANIQQMLDPIVGMGRAVVSVTADLDYDQTERTSESFTAKPSTPPLASSTTEEKYSGGSTSVGGVLGPDNIAVPSGTNGGSGAYVKTSQDVTNAVDKVTEHQTTAPGSVKRQSVSVVISQEAGAGLDLTQIQQMVSAAAGLDPARGDVVSVTRMAFDTTTAAQATAALAAADAAAKTAGTRKLITNGAVALVVVLAVGLMLVSAARRSKRARREALDLGALDLLEAKQAAIIEATTHLPALTAAHSPVMDEMAAKREDVLALAAEQPAEVAETLRGWLAVGKRS